MFDILCVLYRYSTYHQTFNLFEMIEMYFIRNCSRFQMENTESEIYDQKVFRSLVNVIHMITEDARYVIVSLNNLTYLRSYLRYLNLTFFDFPYRIDSILIMLFISVSSFTKLLFSFDNWILIIILNRYQQFIPVLELYINENFYATLAYNKLLIVLRECVDNGTLKPVELTQTMKCLRYVFKFVVRSRTLCSQLNNGKGQEPFEQHLKDVLNSLVKLMFSKSNDQFQVRSAFKAYWYWFGIIGPKVFSKVLWTFVEFLKGYGNKNGTAKETIEMKIERFKCNKQQQFFSYTIKI